ncbi:MAG: hypothetical protein Q8R82_16055, partial [Hyphomonadaceae bacterium]|nr:hypothetical protein [Hyphomonadaceae bacterium]
MSRGLGVNLGMIPPGLTGPDVTAPTITSSAAPSVAENSTLSHALTASESVTWAIRTVGQNGASVDYASFEISGSTLRWVGNGTKDYETPGDTGTNNTYVVVVRATDGSANTADQTITVTVTDVSEGATPAAVLILFGQSNAGVVPTTSPTPPSGWSDTASAMIWNPDTGDVEQ